MAWSGAEPGAAFVAVWRITTHCNLSCPFCGYDRALPFARRHAPVAIIARVLPALQRLARGRAWEVSWLGGEPTLWPAIDAATALARQAGARVSLTTNGWALDQPAWRAWVCENLAALTVSVDDLHSAHDALRGAPGLFARIRDGLASLRDQARRPLLRVNMVLMRDTIARFGALCAALAEAGVDEISVNALGGNDRPEYFAQQRLTPVQLETFASDWADLRAICALRGTHLLGGARYLARLRAAAYGVPMPVEDCAPAQQTVFVDEAGRIAPCSFTVAAYGMPASAIESDAMNDPARLFSAARAQRRAPACADCACTNVFGKFEVAQ